MFAPKSLLWVICLSAALVTMTAAAQADALSLKSRIAVDGATITLGDLFANAGDKSDLVVTAAPAPGRSLVLSPRRLMSLVRKHKMSWRPQPGLRKIIVRRNSNLVSRQDLTAAIVEALAATQGHDRFMVRLLNRRLEIHVPTTQLPTVEVVDFDFDPVSRRFLAVVSAPAGEAVADRHRISGTAYRVAEIPVPTRTIASGEVLTENDIEWLERRADRISRNIVTEADQVIGQAAKRTLRPGQPLRTTDVQRPVLVAKGAVVKLVLASRRMQLVTTAKALRAGGLNDTIDVVNLRSRKTVQAIVVGPNRAEVVVPQGFTTAAR